MLQEEYEAMAKSAAGKVSYLKNNFWGYWILSMLAGIYVGFGCLLAFSIGGQLQGAVYTKTIMGISFGVALSLVVIAGAELFTGNNLAIATGLVRKTVSFGEAIKIWIVCWLGNFAGAVLLALVYSFTGLFTGNVAEFMISGAVAKVSASPVELLMRGILCNILVCLAAWCAAKCESESGKLIMILWCLFAFFTAGFEHSVANMTLLTIAVMNSSEVTLAAEFYNLAIVTIGNMIGGICCVALPYGIIAKKK